MCDALSRQPGVEVVVLAGRADEHRSVPEESPHEVHDVAQIGLWRDDGNYLLDSYSILEIGLDVLHVQYQSMLFQQPTLESLATAFPGVTAITFHDRCVTPDFPYWQFDLQFTHRAEVGSPHAEVISLPVEDRTPVVRTFGLGRTRSDYIRPICERHGWVFEDIATHEPIHGGGQSWRTHEELIQWLRGADAIVLWYDPQPLAGSSQAARTAMAARRMVITNDTEWFSDLPPQAPHYRKVGSLEELEWELCEALADPYIAANSWDKAAARLVERYQAA